MPTLSVAKRFLFQLIGKEYTEEKFDELCFEFGVELDSVTSERDMFAKEHQAGSKGLDQIAFDEKMKSLSDEVLFKIDTPANRYDLLCAEGLAIALRVFQGMMPMPRLKAVAPKLTVTVKKSVRDVRDYIVCAVLRNINFTAERYASFIDFQEKLHSGLARKRSLASVGTHDLDKCAPPFVYEARPKSAISFVPLNQDRTLNCADDGLSTFYKDDKHISRYVPLIASYPNYPTVADANGVLMSLPPIINSNATKITLDTKNVFIECTALDHHKAHVLVNQMVSAFSWYCDEPFSVEQVNVIYEEPITVMGKTLSSEVTPDLTHAELSVAVSAVNSRVGVQLGAHAVAELLLRMQHNANVDGGSVRVSVPPCRSDVLHACDIIEDVAIAYGYDKLQLAPCPTSSAGSQTSINKLTHLLRLEVAAAGYTEMLTFSLCSREEAFSWLGRVDNDVAVHIANPQTFEFQIVRPSLLPGTLKTLNHNRSSPLPLKLFEITDVVLLDAGDRSGARNERHFAAVHVDAESSAFQNIQGLVEHLFVKLGIPKSTKTSDISDGEMHYFIEAQTQDDDGALFAPLASHAVMLRRCSQGRVSLSKIGVLGVVHPRALENFDYPFPCSYCEVNLEPFRESS